MTKIVTKIIILQVLFLLLASSYISLGRFTDSYLSAHRTPERCLIESICTYDTAPARTLSNWKDFHDQSRVFDVIPGIADNVAYSIIDSRAASYLTDVFIVGFWMLLFNAVLLGAWKLKQVRDDREGRVVGNDIVSALLK